MTYRGLEKGDHGQDLGLGETQRQDRWRPFHARFQEYGGGEILLAQPSPVVEFPTPAVGAEISMQWIVRCYVEQWQPVDRPSWTTGFMVHDSRTTATATVEQW